MRTSNKLKIIQIILLLFISIMLVVQTYGQGGPPNGMGGPPTPPPTFCQQFPNHPACANAVQVPLSDWYWEIGLMILGSGFIYYKFKAQNQTT